jgi:hypothetical protein
MGIIKMTTAEAFVCIACMVKILYISNENIHRLNSLNCRAAASSRLYVKYKTTVIPKRNIFNIILLKNVPNNY